MNTKTERFVYLGSGVTILLAIGLLLLFFYWTLYPYHIIDFKLPIAVQNENHEVVRGDKLYLEVNYTKYLQVNGHGESFIICDDGNLVTVVPPRAVGVQFPLGVHTIDFDMTVPMKTSLGTCHFESIINYEVNPFRKIPIEIYTEDFEVIE